MSGLWLLPPALAMLVLGAYAWYLRKKLDSVGPVVDAEEALARDQVARGEAEDNRNAAVVDRWQAGVDSAKENKDVEKAVDDWRSIGGGVQSKDHH